MANHQVAWTDGDKARAVNARALKHPPSVYTTTAAEGDTVTLTGPADSELRVTRVWGADWEIVNDGIEPWNGTIAFNDDAPRAIAWSVLPAGGGAARSGAINWTAETE